MSNEGPTLPPSPINSLGSAQPIHAEHSLRGVSILVVACVVLFGVVVAALYVRDAQLRGGIDTTVGQTNSSLIAYFPNIRPNQITGDPDDTNYLWMSSGAGVSRLDVNTKEVRIFSGAELSVNNAYHYRVAKKGRHLFVGVQGGLSIYNIETGEKNFYNTERGLVNNSNVHPIPDPTDDDVVWVGTFRGLSRLTLSTGVIQNYVSEMGIQGTSIQPVIFHVDAKYVWVNVNSNSYTNGGVARLNKQTGVWTAWNNDSFQEGEGLSRFDSFNTVADGEVAIVEDDNILYRLDPVSEEWTVMKRYSRTDKRAPRMLGLSGNKLYIMDPIPMVWNIDTGVVSDAVPENARNVVKWDRMTGEYDAVQNRILAYPQSGFEEALILLKPETGSLSSIPYSVITAPFTLPDSTLSDASDAVVVVSSKEGIFKYDLTTQKTQLLVKGRAQVVRILDDKVLALSLATCEMFCNIDTLVATSTVVSLTSGETLATATVTGTTTEHFHIGTTLDDVYLFPYNNTSGNGYHLVDGGTSFVYGAMPPVPWEPESLYSSKNDAAILSPDGAYTVSVPVMERGDMVTVVVQSGDSPARTVAARVGPEEHSEWERQSDTIVNSSMFDPVEASILWVGTDRGLLRINVATQRSDLFTSDTGLSSSKVNKLKVTSNTVVLDQPTGVSIYSKEFFK